jgi:hypothetical protein
MSVYLALQPFEFEGRVVEELFREIFEDEPPVSAFQHM